MSLKACLGMTLCIGIAQAAEPPAPATPPAQRAAPAPTIRAPLDLRVGDIRKYMMPNDFRAAISAPDADRDTIVVEGTRLLPFRSMEPIPGGLASLWYAASRPLESWRILAPVVNAPEIRNDNKVPPPIFRWGP